MWSTVFRIIWILTKLPDVWYGGSYQLFDEPRHKCPNNENFPLSQAWGNSISSNATYSSNSQVWFTFLAPKTNLFLYLISSEVQLWSLMIHYHFVLLKLFLLFQNVTAWKWRKQAELQNLKFILSTGKENPLIACDWSTPLLGKAFWLSDILLMLWQITLFSWNVYF